MYVNFAIRTIVKTIKRGLYIMSELIVAIKTKLENTSSSFSISPTTDYNRHVPKSATQLMRNNWRRTGNSLRRAMKKVGDEIEKR